MPQLKLMVILNLKYINLLVLVKAIGHSAKTRFSPPQPLGHPSEESTSHFCEFVVVKQTWSKTPSLSQSTLWYWALLWLHPLGLLQLPLGVRVLSCISVTTKVRRALEQLKYDPPTCNGLVCYKSWVKQWTEAMDFFLDKYFIAQIRENIHLGAKIEANL